MNLPNFDHAAWAAFCQHVLVEQTARSAIALMTYDAPSPLVREVQATWTGPPDIACPDCGYTRAQDEPWCRVCVAKRPEPRVLDECDRWTLFHGPFGDLYLVELGRIGQSYDVFTEADVNTMIEQDDCDVIDWHELPCNVRRVDLTNGESVHYLPQEYER